MKYTNDVKHHTTRNPTH